MKYLTKKDLERSWAFGNDVCQMRREFRKLIDQNPEAFATCIREYMERGASGFPQLSATGGRYPTPKHALAALLADYRIAQEKGITRESFISSEAEQGVRGADKYSQVSWVSESTVRENLKKASKMVKHDRDFAADVDLWFSIGGSRKG